MSRDSTGRNPGRRPKGTIVNHVMYRTAQDLAAARIAEAQQHRRVAAVRSGAKQRRGEGSAEF